MDMDIPSCFSPSTFENCAMESIKKTDAASPEEEPPKEPTEVGPISLLPSTELTLRIGSSFQEAHNNNKNMENLTPDLAEKKFFDGVAEDGDSYAMSDEGQAVHLDFNGNFHPEMDPKKLRRIMSNRLSAQRSRSKKTQHVAEMERQSRFLQTKIALLHAQVAAYEKQQRLLLIEQHRVKLQMAALERERVIKEVEIEMIKAEVNRLTALQWKEQVQAREMRLSWGADLQLMCNSNSNIPSGLGDQD